jgi:CheY-like chemotaxis protein
MHALTGVVRRAKTCARALPGNGSPGPLPPRPPSPAGRGFLRFTCRLPLRHWTNGQLDYGTSVRTLSGMPAAAPWIAVVDDDPSVLKALTRLLRTRAFEAKTYASAQAFLAALPDGVPECLILDLQMPEMSGLELMQHLTLKGIDIPTIIITAYDDNDARQRCEAAGTAGYLLKPLQDTAFFAAIAKARGRGRMNGA